LNVLARACDFAFEVASGALNRQIREGRIDPLFPVYLPCDPGTEVASSHYIFLNRLKSQFPRYIRETIFVRLISTFEVFLVDLVRDVFMHRTDLFQSTNVIELTHAEALSVASSAHLRERVLLKELRQLHSAGIKDIAKYYERRMEIKFPELLDGISRLWEMHDRRHLLVHQLGRADQAYRHKYGYARKGPLSIDEGYLSEAINTIIEFADTLEPKVTALLSDLHNREGADRNVFELEIEVETASDEAEHLFLPSYPFIVNDRATGERGALLSDILAYSRDGEEGVVLLLCSDRETVLAYLSELKKLEKRGLLSIIRKDIHKAPKDGMQDEPPTNLDRDTIEEIARRLPAQPWSKGIHKEIAQALSISNTQCSRAIKTILRDDSLLSLVGIFESG
jgi:hypothetical protein